MGSGGGYQQPMGKGGGYQQPMGYGQPYGGKGGQRFPQQGPTGPYVTDGQYRPSFPNSGQSPYGPFGGPLPGGMNFGRPSRGPGGFQPVAEPAFQPVARPALPMFPSAYDRDPASNSNIGVPAFRDIPEYKALQDARRRQREEMQGLENAFRQTGQYQNYMRELPPIRAQKTSPYFNTVPLEQFEGYGGMPTFMPPRRGGDFVERLRPGSSGQINPIQQPMDKRARIDPQLLAAPVKGGIQPALLTRG